jgi:hypothetical protein
VRPEKSSLQSIRLVSLAQIDDGLTMEKYSGKTRIEPTPLGWLNVAQRRLREGSTSQSKTRQADLKKRAEAAIHFALHAVEGRPS